MVSSATGRHRGRQGDQTGRRIVGPSFLPAAWPPSQPLWHGRIPAKERLDGVDPAAVVQAEAIAADPDDAVVPARGEVTGHCRLEARQTTGATVETQMMGPYCPRRAIGSA
jgi:hypothetical protein